MRKIYLLLLSLLLLPYMAVADTGAFNVTTNEGSSESAYTYSEGVLTVGDGANITISMASGATTPTNDRIVVAANATATITLNEVKITGPARDAESSTPAQSAIDVEENAHLILNLSDNTTNALTGGSGGIDLGAPGIHVPSSASLVIQGSGELSVTGGNSTNTYGGSGIGGKPSSAQAGEACGTVIILATGKVTVTGGTSQTSSSGGADIGGGIGLTDGGNGQGIRPSGDGSYTVWGNLTVPDDITLPEGIILTGDGTISPETAKPKPTITFTDEDLEKTYDGQSASLNSNDYTYTGGGTISIAWYSDYNGTQGGKLDNAPSDAGTYWVGVSAEATNLYQAAEEVTKQFTIKPAIAESLQTPTLEAVTYDVKLSEITLPAGWAWADGETVPTVTNTGYTAYYTVTDYTNYDWSAVEGWNETEYRVERTVELTVKKATPTPDETPTVYTATYGDKLSDISLPEGWAWEDKTQLVGNVGEQKFTAIFTPEDTDNYNTVKMEVTVTVKQADISEQIKAEDGQTVISLDLETGSTILTAYVEGEGIPGDGEWTWEYDESVVAIEEIPETQSIVSKSSRKVTPVSVGITTITATYATDNYTGSISYTLTVTEPEPEEPDTPVTPDYPDYYNIYVDECEGVTVETSTNVVREGNSMSFTIEVAEGYTAEDMVVKVKRSLFGYTDVIEPNEEGKYEIRNIYTEIYITVEGVEKETPTGIEELQSTKVYAQDGSLYVQTSKQEQVVIISISGAVIKNETQIGLKRYDLPRGIYIICIGEERVKVRN